MADTTAGRLSDASQPAVGADALAHLIGRLERLPIGGLHHRARIIIGTATFFDAFDGLSIAFVMPVLIPLWKLTPTDIGLLIAVGYLGQLVGAIFFGWVAEKWGRIPSLIASTAVLSLFSILCMFSTNYWMLFIFRTIQGIGLGGEVPVAAVYINELARAKGRGFFVLIFQMLFSVGMFAAAVLGRILVPTVGWQGMFLIGAIPAVTIVMLQRMLPESPRWLANKGRLSEAERVVAMMEKEAAKGGRELTPVVVKPLAVVKPTRFGELFEGIYRKRTLTVWVMWVCAYFAAYGIQTWLPSLYTTVFKASLEEALTYPLYATGAGVLSCLATVFLIDRTGRKPFFTVAFFGAGLSLVVLWLLGASSATMVAIFATICQFFFATVALALFVYSPEIYPTRMRALGSSVGSAWLRLASAVGPYIMGFMVPMVGIGGSFLVFGLVLILGGIVTAAFAVETNSRVLEEVSP